MATSAAMTSRERIGKRAMRRRADDLMSLYEVGAHRRSPTINLADTPGSRLLSVSANEKLLVWMRAHYGQVSSVTRVCAGMIFASWALPARIGQILTPIATLGCLPIVILSPLVMSTELLLSLIQHHEFWFFIVTNTINWLIAAVLFNDVRATGCFACFLLNVLTIMMDANFRTIVPAVRTGLAWVPAIICIVVVCVTKVVDIDPERFNAIFPKNKIGFNLANSFINVNMTLVIFVVRLTYRRRRVFTKQFLSDRMIPCCVIRCDLVLRRMERDNRGSVSRLNAFLSRSSVNPQDFLLRTPSFTINANEARLGTIQTEQHAPDEHAQPTTKGVEREEPIEQVMQVVTPTIAFLDLRKSLIPVLVPPTRIALWKAVVLYAIGLVGLLLSGFTMYLPATHSNGTAVFDDILGVANLFQNSQLVVPALSFLCTSIFIIPFLASYQRDLLVALWRNFDFGFSSLQFLVACACLADMMHWDFRCLALLSWIQWFHWVLLWDALLPEIRHRFRFKKIYGTPVLVGMQLGLAWIIYSLFFSSYDALNDRVLTNVSWGSFQLGIRTSTFLVGRITTILAWSLRISWKAMLADEDDLIFIRGQLSYHTPLSFFPPIEEPSNRKKPAIRSAFHRLLRCCFLRPPTAIHPLQAAAPTSDTDTKHATRRASPTASLLIPASIEPTPSRAAKTPPLEIAPATSSPFSLVPLDDEWGNPLTITQ